jgi:hypothetical protein
VSETQSKRVELKDLKEGDVIWCPHFGRYLTFQEYVEDDGFFFKNTFILGFTVLNKGPIYEPSSLIKELL